MPSTSACMTFARLGLWLALVTLAAGDGNTRMDVDLAELLRQTGLEAAQPKMLAHGVSNLHTLMVLEDSDIEALELPPMLAKLFRNKRQYLIADLEKKKGTPVSLPSEADEAERKRKKEELLQDMLYCIAAVIIAGVGIFVYVFYFQKPTKLRQD